MTLSLLAVFPSESKASELKPNTIPTNVTESSETIVLEKGMKIDEMPLYAPQLGNSLIYEQFNQNKFIKYAVVDQGGGGAYQGWKRETSYKFTADTSVPALPDSIAIAWGAAGIKYPVVGIFGFGYDLAVRVDNILASHNRSYGTIAIYKHPSKNQWVSLWTVWDHSGYLIYSKFGNVVTKRPTF